MRFSQIPGLDTLKSQLCVAVRRSHVSHAQLMHGAEGGMQLGMALAFATYINCEEKTDTDSCGQCASCRKMDKLAHPDLHFVFPTVNTKKVKNTDDDEKGPSNADEYMPYWRDFVNKQFYGDLAMWHDQLGAEKNQQAIIPVGVARKILLKLGVKAYEGNYKIMIIWLPELMNVTAANAILKILEEPPEKTLFLLVSNNADKLLQTIRSRTIGVHVPPVANDAISKYLQENIQLDPQRANQISILADGNLLQATQIANNSDENLFESFRGWMLYCFKNNILELIKLAEQFDTMDKTLQKQMMEYGLAMFRNIMIYLQVGESLLKLDSTELEFVKKFANTIHITKIQNIAELFSETHYYLERNAKAKIMFMDLSLQLIKYFKR